MKNKTLPLVVALGILGSSAAVAASDLYSANEGSLDLFGFYGSKDKNGHSDAWGMGVGGNYFFTENIGAGLDTYADAFELPYLLNASAIYRYPIGDTAFAPYGFGGLGREWTHTAQWMGHVGGGVEYRMRQQTGLFADIRGVFPSETKDYAVLRFGFRIRFK